MTDFEVLLLALIGFAFVLGLRLGRFLGRREATLRLQRAAAASVAFVRARSAQDASEHQDVFRVGSRLSEAERDAWNARDLA